MTGKRTRYSADFKSKVALEALRGELTTAQLAAKHGIHQTMVGGWKRQANAARPHSAWAGLTPDETYGANEVAKLAT